MYADLGLGALARHGVDPKHAVLWGVGRSLKRAGERLSAISELPYLTWGLRDVDGVADPARFLPCVSCLHPMLDAPVNGHQTLLFLNADPRVTERDAVIALKAYALSKGWRFMLNDCTELQFRSEFDVSDRILTNSFHAAYWGLLSGRRVGMVGYSTKFNSLLRALRLDDRTLPRYEKPRKLARVARWLGAGGSGLPDMLTMIEEEQQFLLLPAADATLAEFRGLNMAFARSLLALGAYQAVEPLTKA